MASAREGNLKLNSGCMGIDTKLCRAVLIAAGQEIVARVTAMWLRAHEAFLVSLGSRDVQRISGVDDQMDRAVRKNRWLSRIGWLLFVAGIVLQIIPHFRHDRWRALCEPMFNLCSGS
jgi:hypothetical protein